MLRLTDLLDQADVHVTCDQDIDDITIESITTDSRKVEKGCLFAAISGTKVDGSQFISDAIKKGAVAVLMDKSAAAQHVGVPLLSSDNVRRDAAKLAGVLYSPHPKNIVAVTGTNGKTSVAEFVRQIVQHSGQSAASIGTLGLTSSDEQLNKKFPAINTSPEPVLLAQILQQCAQHHIDSIAIEASSHGLHQYRLDGIQIAAAAFTNLSHDHLDYHANMNDYFAAKSRLFLELALSKNVAVINVDDAYGKKMAGLCAAQHIDVWDYGETADTLRIVSCVPTTKGLQAEVKFFDELIDITLPLFGSFQLGNALAAAGLAVASGVSKEEVLKGLAILNGAKGRMEHVTTLSNGAACFVDYAHTPDALEKVLIALRDHTQKKLCVIFGCGGDRDTEKRSEMGAISERLADHIIVTDDNPRTEDPVAIRHEILTACPHAVDIGDRKEAICYGVNELSSGDILVVAGKGHENYQIIGEQSYPFDDTKIIKEAVGSL